MCLIALALGRHPRLPLVLAANRDEFFDRPTSPLGWWAETRADPGRDADPGTPLGTAPGPALLGGRDLLAGGSWMALSARGRLALLTNLRRPGPPPPQARSRGALVPAWLRHSGPADDFIAGLDAGAHAGFNLLVGDLGAQAGPADPGGRASGGPAPGGRWHVAQGGAGLPAPRARPLSPGVHGLSNAELDTPWPKLVRLRAALDQALSQVPDAEQGIPTDAPIDPLIDALLHALADPTPAAEAELPDTGLPRDWERWLSPVFIRTPDGRYGTRSSTVLIVEAHLAGRRLHWVERTHPGRAGEVGADRRFTLALEQGLDDAGRLPGPAPGLPAGFRRRDG